MYSNKRQCKERNTTDYATLGNSYTILFYPRQAPPHKQLHINPIKQREKEVATSLLRRPGRAARSGRVVAKWARALPRPRRIGTTGWSPWPLLALPRRRRQPGRMRRLSSRRRAPDKRKRQGPTRVRENSRPGKEKTGPESGKYKLVIHTRATNRPCSSLL